MEDSDGAGKIAVAQVGVEVLQFGGKHQPFVDDSAAAETGNVEALYTGGAGTVPGILLGALFLETVTDSVAKLATGQVSPDELEGLVVGLLVRSGRGWVLAINVLAVATFVYLTAGLNPITLFFAAVYGAVFALILANRPWFDQLSAWRGTRAARATVRR